MSDMNNNFNDRDDEDDVVSADADDAREPAPVTEVPVDGAPIAPAAGTTHAQVGTGQAFSQPVASSHRGRFVAGVAVLALACGLLGGIGASAAFDNARSTTTQSSTTGETGSGGSIKSTNVTSSSSLTKVINANLPSIVTIGVTGSQESGTGSGVVINGDGYIVTNAHVATLEGATSNGTITVRTSSGDTYKATLVGYDATADVAVIKVAATAKGMRAITFANSDTLQVGDTAIAIGSPLGLSGTVTTGIVSALNRPIQVQSAAVGQSQAASQGNATVALSAIQTDAAINQGNSGGALLDGNGNLIGLNDAIATSGDSSGSIGIGFSIPGNYVKRVAEEIIKNGDGQHGYLGVSLIDYAAAGASFPTGAKIQSLVSDGPGAKGKLAKGDVITKINDTVIESSTQATAIIKQLMPNSMVKVTVTRNGTDQVLTVTLGTTKNQ